MILKPFTGICLLAAAGSGLYLYQTKHHAQVLERNIARTMKSADTVRQRAGLMRAEYTLLNAPSRLAELSEQLLPMLKTTAPGQFASLADFEKRLPAIGAPPVPEPLEPAAPDAVLPKAAPKTEQFMAAPTTPEPAKVEPARVEPAKPEPPRQPLIASRPAPPKPTILAAAAASVIAPAAAAPPSVAPAVPVPVIATPLPAPRAPIAAAPVIAQPLAPPPRVPASAPTVVATPLPLHQAPPPARPVVAASAIAAPPVAAPIVATPVAARPAPVISRPAYAAPAYAPPTYAPPTYAPVATPITGSALGMARSMPAAAVVTPARGPAFTPYGRP